MAQQNAFSEFFSQSDFTKAMEQYQNLPFDMSAVLEIQRRNVQALTEAQQISIQRFQEIAQRQSEIVSQIMEDNSAIAKEFMGEGTPEEKIAKNADLFKKVYERTVKNMGDLSDLINKSNEEATTILTKRVSASMGEIKKALEETNTQKKAA